LKSHVRSARSVGVFVFYSNRLGCAGSALVSLAATAVLGFVIWLIAP